MNKFLIFCFIIIVLSSFKVVAHSPSSLNINYYTETKMLTVDINHIVSDPTAHYIYNISIEKNNEFYKNFDYTNQPTSSSFNYNYSGVDGNVGDMFSVIARCNQGGQISKSLTIGSDTGNTSTPGFEIIIFIFAIILILFCKIRRKISNH